jgi:hypothetical protein
MKDISLISEEELKAYKKWGCDRIIGKSGRVPQKMEWNGTDWVCVQEDEDGYLPSKRD